MTIIDVGEVRTLGADLGKASIETQRLVAPVLERAALNVKTKMVEDASNLTGYAKHFRKAISYDATPGFTLMGYDIGPDKERMQGALGNLLYFGSSKNAPVLDLEAGLIEEEPRFIKSLGKVLEHIL